MSAAHDELRRTSGKCATRNTTDVRRSEGQANKKREARKRYDADGDGRHERRSRCRAQHTVQTVFTRAMTAASAVAAV